MVLAIGYVYGIVRANVQETLGHFIFDAAVLGFYITQFSRRYSSDQEAKIRKLKPWFEALMILPVLMFFVPLQDWLVRLVGLRGGIFLLPFLLIGAWLEPGERYTLALWLAGFNVAALAFAGVEFVVGVEPFFPRNNVTYLIYMSKDVLGSTAYRIPSFFNNSHSYAGAITFTLPLLLGAMVQKHKQRWIGKFLGVALGATFLGVFVAAVRTPVILAGIVVLVATFSLRNRVGFAIGWLIILVSVGWIVSGEERLQRFMLLKNTDSVAERFSMSVNTGFIDMVQSYPFGNGLGGGGTSMPYWMEGQVRNRVMIENEYARIVAEQGVIGLVLWIGFLFSVFSRYSSDSSDPWHIGRRLAWVLCLAQFATGLIGTGILTAIPQTCLLLLLMGWVASVRVQENCPETHFLKPIRDLSVPVSDASCLTLATYEYRKF
jgi:hypothetical protein